MRCDSHVHIVGPADRYPQVAERTYLADVATLGTLQRAGSARDVTRFVIVQPSFYGHDNTLLLESLDALGGKGRGVAVVDPATTSSATLADFARRGVCGLRLNLYSAASRDYSVPLQASFAAVAAVAQDMGAWALPGSPAECGKLIDDEIEKWAKVIRAGHIKAS